MTTARTCADLRRVVSEQDLRRAVRQAAVLGLSLGAEVAHDGTRTDLELRFLGLCRRHGLPAPQANRQLTEQPKRVALTLATLLATPPEG